MEQAACELFDDKISAFVNNVTFIAAQNPTLASTSYVCFGCLLDSDRRFIFEPSADSDATSSTCTVVNLRGAFVPTASN